MFVSLGRTAALVLTALVVGGPRTGHTAPESPPATVTRRSHIGDQIAFASRRDGTWEIYVMQPDGVGQARLTRGAHNQKRFPIWSPDRTRIAFASQEPPGFDPWVLWVMNADGTAPVEIARDIVGKSNREWTPDGTRIVFTGMVDGEMEVLAVDVHRRQVTRLTTSAGEDRDPSISPDGRQIAYSVDSRFYGTVPRDNLRGTTMFVYYSFDTRDGIDPISATMHARWRRVGTWIR